MVKHIVLWRLRETARAEEQIARAQDIKQRLEALRGRIPGLLAIEVGLDFNRGAEAADIALYSEFENRAALTVYQGHPLHEAVKPIVAAACRERRVVDYEV